MIHVHILVESAHSGHPISLPYQGQNLEAIVDLLDISRSDIGLIVANGRPARLADLVDDASVVYILPSIEGG